MQVWSLLAEMKRKGFPWEVAWINALRHFEEPPSCPPEVAAALAEDREMMRENKPWWQAAYEDREVTATEFERAMARTERRLDEALAA